MTRIVTKEGLKKLKDEFEERTITIRQKIAKSIKEAKDQGDLSENAEYSAARSEQSDNEQRITELEVILKDVEVAERLETDAVQIGSAVEVTVSGRKILFYVVGSNEADPASNKISNESPIGRALLGHNEGDKVTVATPSGDVSYTIVSVK